MSFFKLITLLARTFRMHNKVFIHTKTEDFDGMKEELQQYSLDTLWVEYGIPLPEIEKPAFLFLPLDWRPHQLLTYFEVTLALQLTLNPSNIQMRKV